MPRLVERDRVGTGTSNIVTRPKPRSVTGTENVAPFPSRSARVASMSSHISAISWWRGELNSWPSYTLWVGCTPISLGPVPKISQPGSGPVSSTWGHPRTSRRNALVAGGSSE